MQISGSYPNSTQYVCRRGQKIIIILMGVREFLIYNKEFLIMIWKSMRIDEQIKLSDVGFTFVKSSWPIFKYYTCILNIII